MESRIGGMLRNSMALINIWLIVLCVGFVLAGDDSKKPTENRNQLRRDLQGIVSAVVGAAARDAEKKMLDQLGAGDELERGLLGRVLARDSPDGASLIVSICLLRPGKEKDHYKTLRWVDKDSNGIEIIFTKMWSPSVIRASAVVVYSSRINNKLQVEQNMFTYRGDGEWEVPGVARMMREKK
jgi:hypothetical protein